MWYAIRAYFRLPRNSRDSWPESGGPCKKFDLIKSILIAARLRPRRRRRRATIRSLNIQAHADRLKSCLWVRCCVAPGFCRTTSPANRRSARSRDDRWSRRATAFNRRDIASRRFPCPSSLGFRASGTRREPIRAHERPQRRSTFD